MFSYTTFNNQKDFRWVVLFRLWNKELYSLMGFILLDSKNDFLFGDMVQFWFSSLRSLEDRTNYSLLWHWTLNRSNRMDIICLYYQTHWAVNIYLKQKLLLMLERKRGMIYRKTAMRLETWLNLCSDLVSTFMTMFTSVCCRKSWGCWSFG